MINVIYSVLLIFTFMVYGCTSTGTINKQENNKYGLTQEQYNYVKNETVPDGKLDFEKQFQTNQLVLFDDVAYNKRDAALYTWALTMKKLGIKNVEDAIALYEDLRSTKLKNVQKIAMQNGFNK